MDRKQENSKKSKSLLSEIKEDKKSNLPERSLVRQNSLTRSLSMQGSTAQAMNPLSQQGQPSHKRKQPSLDQTLSRQKASNSNIPKKRKSSKSSMTPDEPSKNGTSVSAPGKKKKVKIVSDANEVSLEKKHEKEKKYESDSGEAEEKSTLLDNEESGSRYWIYQCNPDIFKVDEYLVDKKEIGLTFGKENAWDKNKIKEIRDASKNKIFIWKAKGKNSKKTSADFGIVAHGEITAVKTGEETHAEYPQLSLSSRNSLCIPNDRLDHRPGLIGLKIKLSSFLSKDSAKPILSKYLLKKEFTDKKGNKESAKYLSILTAAQGTLFRINANQYNRLLSLLPKPKPLPEPNPISSDSDASSSSSDESKSGSDDPAKPQEKKPNPPNSTLLIANIEGQTYAFEEHQISRDGDCGFTSLATTRQTVVDSLKRESKDEKARLSLRGELHEFVTGLEEDTLNILDNKAITEAYKRLEECQKAEKKLDDLLKIGNDYLQKQRKSRGKAKGERCDSADALIQALEGLNPKDKKLIQLKELQSAYLVAQKDYDKELTSRDMVSAYLDAYVDNNLNPALWLGYQTAKWFMRVKGFNLYIWERYPTHSRQLRLRDSYIAGPSRPGLPEYHLLHTDGYTHFNLLSVPTPSSTAEIIGLLTSPKPGTEQSEIKEVRTRVRLKSYTFKTKPDQLKSDDEDDIALGNEEYDPPIIEPPKPNPLPVPKPPSRLKRKRTYKGVEYDREEMDQKTKDEIGQRGELYVYRMLRRKYQKKYAGKLEDTETGFKITDGVHPGVGHHPERKGEARTVEVQWHNKKIGKGKENCKFEEKNRAQEEDNVDLTVIKTRDGGKPKERHIEVKATRSMEAHPTELPKSEWKAMRKYGERYSIFRVFNIDKEHPGGVLIKKKKNPLEKIRQGKIGVKSISLVI